MTAIFVFDTAKCYDSDIWMDYPKLISEKWNLTAKFNCLQAIYFDAPRAKCTSCPYVWATGHSYFLDLASKIVISSNSTNMAH